MSSGKHGSPGSFCWFTQQIKKVNKEQQGVMWLSHRPVKVRHLQGGQCDTGMAQPAQDSDRLVDSGIAAERAGDCLRFLPAHIGKALFLQQHDVIDANGDDPGKRQQVLVGPTQ